MKHHIKHRPHIFFLTLIWQLLIPSYCLLAHTHFIFITGGSACGKSTFAKALVNELGHDVACCISLDEYLDKNIQPKEDFVQGIPNFDNPSMINWPLLLEHLSCLKKGLPIAAPVYDFSLWTAVGSKPLPWKPVVIVEGIHAGHAPLDCIAALRIFLEVDEHLRYERRQIRDAQERGYSIDMIKFTFYTLAIPYEKIFIEPIKHHAHILIKDLEGYGNLEKTAARVTEIFQKNKNTDFKNIKLKISYQQEGLIEEQSFEEK